MVVDPEHITTTARDVFDVSGAGVTVISVAAAALANCAAGVVVEKVGTGPISMVELAAAVRGRRQASADKIFSFEEPRGGRVVLVPLKQGISTSEILHSVKGRP